jgi:CHAT domain-containing protein
LFFLNGCESGRAAVEAGDELQGLVWALVYAGAEAVMASLWEADDAAAQYMALRFYDHWQPGVSLMKAYQDALRDLRQEPDFQNPYYWAPFVLFGNGFHHDEE